MILERTEVLPISDRDLVADNGLDNKRKASEQLDGGSPTKRVKDSLSSSATPEGDVTQKPRVVPFPEKVVIAFEALYCSY